MLVDRDVPVPVHLTFFEGLLITEQLKLCHFKLKEAHSQVIQKELAFICPLICKSYFIFPKLKFKAAFKLNCCKIDPKIKLVKNMMC